MEGSGSGATGRSTGRATIYDVAARAGVSIKTVSRVANDAPEVTAETRERVQAAMAELAYVRNPAARALVTGAASTIGVVVDSIADRFFAALVSVVEERALAHGISVVIASTGRSPQRERDQIRRLVQQNVAALVVAPVAGDHAWIEQSAPGLPVVLVDRGWERPGYDTVRVQDREGARTATEHLLAHGHRRIAFLGESTAVETVAARRAGFEAALRAHRIRPEARLVSERCSDLAAAEDVTRSLLAATRPPTAILASNPRAAMGAVSALHAADRTDIALVSFGDFDLAESLVPAVTVMDHDPRQLGEAAVTRLLARLADPALPATDIYLPTKLIERGSGELLP